MANVNDIRKEFINFFKKHDHNPVSSSALIPHNDASLMFANSGMVQFKNFFTGTETPPYKRAVSAQKCVRAGGKHNDLENVGFTARHHTFFEMLGNFSFGDYFKEEAIFYAWDLITKTFKLPKDKLYVTVFHNDLEAINLWRKIAGLNDDRIIKISTNDNFWSMGDTGPCGPCTEIFYDHGSHIEGGLPGTHNEDGDRYVEIWNLVFMQFEQFKNGDKVNLKKPSIDTGMGLERIAAVLQNVCNNYDIDLFKNLIADIASATKTSYIGQASHRVIADHLRASTFLLADGIMPSNEGRGYVLRRILRRAMRHINMLGVEEPILYKLVSSLSREMGEAYPELLRAEELIKDIIKLEEEKFIDMLKRGMRLLSDEMNNITNNTLDGAVAFKLYDTYGFPLDLTADILKTSNTIIDISGFEQAMQQQKIKARNSWSGSGEKDTSKIWYEIKEKIENTEFVGYEHNNIVGKLVAILHNDTFLEEADKEGMEIVLLFNQSPFYGESGGQVGDKGRIYNDNASLNINTTKKILGNLILHFATLKRGKIVLGQDFHLIIDEERRQEIRKNHSATHILHFVLRKILGNHVTQKGSLVDATKLRFDFSHNKPLTSSELQDIEIHVNKIIQRNYPAITKIMPSKEAIESGAMALFGEKYDEMVRVVSMGEVIDTDLSVELCGGTHITQTGDIGLFKITSESAIASGVRRIEAITSIEAIKYVQNKCSVNSHIASLLKANDEEIITKIKNLLDQNKSQMQKIEQLEINQIINNIKTEQINRSTFISIDLSHYKLREYKKLVQQIFTKYHDNTIIFLYIINEDKVNCICAVSENIKIKVNAVTVIQHTVQILGGKGGGGQENFAQGGGINTCKIEEAILSLKNYINIHTNGQN